TLCSKNDVVNLTLSRREFSGCWQRASNVGSVQGVFAGRVNQHDIAVSNCFGVLRRVQHGGIEARSHDGSIRWVLASALSPLVLHKRGISRSVIPGFVARIAARCAATEASVALRIRSISPASLTVRSEASNCLTS